MLVRKNSKEFKHAMSNAVNVITYRLDNYFEGRPIESMINFLDNFRKGESLTKHEGKYKYRVHSNLWYTFDAA